MGVLGRDAIAIALKADALAVYRATILTGVKSSALAVAARGSDPNTNIAVMMFSSCVSLQSEGSPGTALGAEGNRRTSG